MQHIIEISSQSREELIDITSRIEGIIRKSSLSEGIIALYAKGATAAIMIQENWDNSISQDVVNFLARLVPEGIWLHDRQDGNGDAHIKSGLVGPSETVPVIDGRLGLSQWQNIFFCEFDGPRASRQIVCTLLESSPIKNRND